MVPRRTSLRLDEYEAYGPSLRGITRSLPFGNYDISVYRNADKLAQEREESNRRRNRLRQIALGIEEWKNLVRDMTALYCD